MGMDFFISFPFPNCGNGFFSFPSHSRILGMDFFHSLPVPEFWEWDFFIPFPFPKFGNGFFYSLPVPEFREWAFSIPFPFPNPQKSFPLTPVLFKRWKVLICGNPSADCLIIYQICQSSSEDLVPLSELESTYNGSPPGENFAFSGNESHLGSKSLWKRIKDISFCMFKYLDPDLNGPCGKDGNPTGQVQ